MRVLYDDIASHGTKDNPNRDRIILSKGHGVLAQAVLLADKGYFPLEELDKFCHKYGIIGGHPSPDKMPGIECHTGALGHGLSIGIGMAFAAKIRKQNHHIFVIVGDGECNEGAIWEAALCAAKHKLDNITLIVDYNKLQSSGFGKDICPLEPLGEKWCSFGFYTLNCDGHDIDELKGCMQTKYPNKPVCIIANTIKGKGISFAENNPMWHYKGGIDDKLMAELEAGLDSYSRA